MFKALPAGSAFKQNRVKSPWTAQPSNRRDRIGGEHEAIHRR